MRSVDTIRMGDIVERIYGTQKGITGKVVNTKPRVGSVTTHIKVQVDFKAHQVSGKWRAIYNRIFRDRWTSIGCWRRIDG